MSIFLTLDAAQKFALKSNTKNADAIRDFFVTTLKVVQQFHGSQIVLREPSAVVKYRYCDTVEPDSDVLTIGIHEDLRSPNALYVLHAGHDRDRNHDISKFGISDNFPRRKAEHNKELQGNKVLLTVNTGAYSSKPLEDTVKDYTRDCRVHMMMTKNDNVTTRWEFFQTDYKTLDEYLDGLVMEIKRLHSNVIYSMSFRGDTDYFNNETVMRKRGVDDMARAHELEMAKQLTLQKQLELDLERERMLFAASPELYVEYMKKQMSS